MLNSNEPSSPTQVRQAVPLFVIPGSELQFRPDLLALGSLAALNPILLAGQVEVTSRCFQSCLGCDSWREDLAGTQTGEWSCYGLFDFVRQLRRFSPKFKHLSLTGGDPQAWPHLSEFLRLVRDEFPDLEIQLNTALTQDVVDRYVWKTAINDLRISLDGVTEAGYNAIRGKMRPVEKEGKRAYEKGAATTPEQVIRRMIELQHERLTTNTTIFHQNIQEARPILARLKRAVEEEGLLIRKAHFMAAIGDRGPKDVLQHSYLQEWRELYAMSRDVPFETNITESPLEVRKFLASGKADGIPCYAGGVSFHIKPNGDWYPCCLVGGEALETKEAFKMGNAKREPISEIMSRYKPKTDYASCDSPCKNICQWKQLQVNAAGHLAASKTLAMP